MKKEEMLDRWTSEKSKQLYRTNDWGAGYFDVSPDGFVTVTPGFSGSNKAEVKLLDVVSGITERGLDMPVLLRIENLLDAQITRLNQSFAKSMKKCNYQGTFRGVFPIKVNQQQQVLEEVTRFGAQYHHGLEAGSKAELIAALALLEDKEACLICNGYKDEEFVDLGLEAIKMGYKCFFVIEMPGELDLVLRRAEELNIEPNIGVRLKISTKAGGNWSESGGDRSIFGLSPTQLIEAVDVLKGKGMLHCLRLLHFHLGSQIPNIRDIRLAVLEAGRFYADLVEEGASMGYLDIGGGLAIDYDGSQTNYTFSKNYNLDEYTTDVVEVVISVLDGKNIPHPIIISESGRATVAYYSVLLVNVLDTARFAPNPLNPDALKDMPEMVENLYEVYKTVNQKNVQECLNDAIYYRDEIRQQFKVEQITLRQRSYAENLFQLVMLRISEEIKNRKRIPSGLENLDEALADIFYANFSVFQSLPDAWAIDQVFPIMPIHRLNERPSRKGILADITCDSDGKIDQFIGVHDLERTLPLHELNENDEYYLGVFLVGAYQETLGDLHNLFGDTNVVSIRINQDGTFDFIQEIEGDTISDVLEYVEYDIKSISERFRQKAEKAVKEGYLTPRERKGVVARFEAGLRGYTYYER
ncbi:MAG: biosynthetic arginine decarboxylase [Spirochaetia bacterium]|nr:biosynthetic arginine decarboxylase [Spirochaetia bacterium]